MLKRIVFAGLCLMGLFSFLKCSKSTPDFKARMKQLSGREEMQGLLKEFIIVGMELDSAKLMMEKNGFKCSLNRQQDFVEMDNSKMLKHHQKIDYLYCDLEQRSKGSIFVSSRYQVGLVITDNRVSDILISYGLTGL